MSTVLLLSLQGSYLCSPNKISTSFFFFLPTPLLAFLAGTTCEVGAGVEEEECVSEQLRGLSFLLHSSSFLCSLALCVFPRGEEERLRHSARICCNFSGLNSAQSPGRKKVRRDLGFPERVKTEKFVPGNGPLTPVLSLLVSPPLGFSKLGPPVGRRGPPSLRSQQHCEAVLKIWPPLSFLPYF